MVLIKQELIDEIERHSREALPNEACGYLAGKDDTLLEYYAMTNVDSSHEHYSMDPQEQFDVMREVRNKKLRIMAVYHSHPETAARPSDEDIRLAYDPLLFYAIGSLKDPEYCMKIFKIIHGRVEPVEFSLLDNR